MKKLMLSIFCSTALLLLVIDTSAQQQVKRAITDGDWVGNYEYTYTEGKTAGGSVPTIEYLLIVSREGDSMVAHFTADGYQTYHDYTCTAKANGNRLDFYFLRDLNDADTSGTKRRLKKGRLVGSLVKTVIRGKVKYRYKDGAYEISFGAQNPVYFKKTK